MSVQTAVPPARVLPIRSKLAFGIGSIAYGIKDNGFATFLLLFYNQVVGLPATTVGAAILFALLIEAFVDPLVGFLSDHTRSRWGRRLPWMYGSALPVAIGWVLLWHPPAWSASAVTIYLFGSALLVRIALSAFEIPASAMGPELSSDYDERTRLFSYRYLFGWAGGLAMLSLAYAVFLVPDATHAIGLQNGAGYGRMAWFGAIAMLVTIVISAVGMQPEVKYFPKQPARGDETLADHVRILRQTISNRAFIILMIASIAAYTAQGLSFALSNYMYQYVWRLHGADYQWLAVALLLGAGMAFVMAPQLSKGGEKRRIGAALGFGNAILAVLPYVLRQIGLFPDIGSPLLLPLLLGIFVFNTACGVGAFILGSAMLSDVVEEAERRTGKRSEGIFFSGSFFVQKTTTGLGTFLAGLVLTIAAFPVAAKPDLVPPDVINRLVLLFIVLMVSLYGFASYMTSRFPFGRAEHLARISAMAAAD